MLNVAQMSGVVAARKRKSTFLARKAFGYLTPQIKRVIEIVIDLKKGNERLAPLVTPLLGNPVLVKEGFARLRLEIPLVGAAVETSVERKFKVLEGMADIIESDLHEVIDTLLEDTALVDAAITRTEEYMAAQLLKTGSATITGIGIGGKEISYSIDFQRNAAHRLILTSGSKWGDSGVSPYADVKTMRQTIAVNGGLNPDTIVMGEEAADLFLSDPKIEKLLDNRGMDYGKISPEEFDVDVTYLGYIRQIGHLYQYLGGYDDTNGTKQRYIPARGVSIFSSAADNRTIYGGVAVNMNDRPVIQQGRRVVSHSVTKRQPVMENLDVNSRVILVLTEPDTTGYLEV